MDTPHIVYGSSQIQVTALNTISSGSHSVVSTFHLFLSQGVIWRHRCHGHNYYVLYDDARQPCHVTHFIDQSSTSRSHWKPAGLLMLQPSILASQVRAPPELSISTRVLYDVPSAVCQCMLVSETEAAADKVSVHCSVCVEFIKFFLTLHWSTCYHCEYNAALYMWVTLFVKKQTY